MQDNRKTKAMLIEELEELRGRVRCLEGALEKYMDLGVGLRIYKTLFSEIDDLAFIWDANGKIVLVNEAFEKMTGASPGGVTGRPFAPLFAEDALGRAREAYRNTLKGGSPRITLRFRDSGVVSEFRFNPMRDREGAVIGVMGIARDVIERFAVEEEDREREAAERAHLALEHRKLSTAIEQSADIVFITGKDGTIEYVNPRFEAVTGFSSEEAVGARPSIFSSGETPPGQYSELWGTILGGSTWRGIFKNRKKDGELYWAHAVVTPIIDDDGEISNFLAVQEDITEKRASTEKIEFLARYDATTGLINRGWFIERLNGWIAGPEGASSNGALLLIDIDQFKLINDTYGHGMGDEFLHRVGKLLEMNLRYIASRYFDEPDRETMLCRLSGDEFAVFMPGVRRVESVVVAEQLRKGLEGFYQADVSCHLTASIGAALFPEHGRSASELLTRADAAMYRAKELGRNRQHVYSPEDRAIEQMHHRLKWKESILGALKEDRFEAWYQPIMCLKEGGVRHYEVLARMRGREGGVVLPGPFIDIAERFGLVGPIARAVVVKALELQAALYKRGTELTFCHNISGKQLDDPEYLYFLQSKIYETGVNPERIIFEVTETAAIQDLDVAVKFLRSLKAIGCRVSLDDFGIGFTSFLYLKEMQVDFVKIAGPFIKDMDKNLNDQLFVKAINDVAKGMGIKVIAEFVESEEVVGVLREIGVDYAQGYFIGEPSTVPEFDGEGAAE